MRLMALFLSICLAGCAQQVPLATANQAKQANAVVHSQIRAKAPQIPPQIFATAAAVPDLAELSQLTAAQQQDFLSYFHHPRYADQTPEYRLYSYMQNVLAVFQFNGSTTSASEVMRSGSANCVSLALLTKALADLAGIDLRFRATYREPVIDIRGDLLLQATHVRSYLNADPDSNTIRQLYIDYFRGPLSYQGDFLSDSRFKATVYNNLAAEALLRGEYDQAYALIKTSLQQDDQFVPAINLMAVLLRRQQQPELAQQWYQYGLAVAPQHLALLHNYQVLATQLGDQPLVQQLEQQLALADSDDPFELYIQAVQAEQAGREALAIGFYQRLQKRVPYLLQANQALVRHYLKNHQYQAARQLLEQALEYSYEPEKRSLLEHKLAMLRTM
ncbi:tetratricopeptide repeat protein [Rheinheimera sp.]|uniref:tetratricopeptide repeat protein n=1 Tax=Rheinheimera sp. TaxID=1869214 RepID=UPI003D2C3EFC